MSTTNFRWLACVEGRYHNPVRIVAFNTAEGWSRDVTVEIADELRRCYVEFGEVPDAILDLMETNRRWASLGCGIFRVKAFPVAKASA